MNGKESTPFLCIQNSLTIQEKRSKSIVVKFGGTSVESPEKIMHCAEMVKREVEKGEKVVVVVSAQAGDTDRLTELAKRLDVPRDSRDEIVSMGERVSMRLMCAVLTSMGIPSQFIDPIQEEWPVLTDSNHGVADVILKKTKKKVQTVINPLLDKGIVPVLGGFIGKSAEGKVTTLGRGGSDITGVLLGHCLNADVYIVTDVEGVYSADPNKIKNPKLIPEIRAEELWYLGIHGARVLHPRSLIYKTEDMKLKILSNQRFLDELGTTVSGVLTSKITIFCDKKEKSVVSVVGEGSCNTSELLKKVSDALGDITIYALSGSTSSLSFIIDSDSEEDAVQALHTLVLRTPALKAVTSRKGIASILFTGWTFPQKKGLLRRIGKVLEDADINPVNITTNVCEAMVFVDWNDLERTKSVLEMELKRPFGLP
jgi:aspartate kinase